MDSERDRKICIALAQKADGANRELAQWLLDAARTVSEWLGEGYSKSNINCLRKWAANGFVDSPRANGERTNERRRMDRPPVQEALKTTAFWWLFELTPSAAISLRLRRRHRRRTDPAPLRCCRQS